MINPFKTNDPDIQNYNLMYELIGLTFSTMVYVDALQKTLYKTINTLTVVIINFILNVHCEKPRKKEDKLLVT